MGDRLLRWLLAKLNGHSWTPPAEASQLPESAKTTQELTTSEERP